MMRRKVRDAAVKLQSTEPQKERRMSQVKTFTYHSADKKTDIHAVEWIPEGEVKGILQIVHGMLEFIERYEEFAQFLNEHGILVVGHDHLGHGVSVRSASEFGYFAEENGNKVLLADIRELQRITREKYPEVPYFLLGHSMGSFLARQYLYLYGSSLDGAIICGTGWHSRMETTAGMILCRLIAARKGWKYRSKLVTQMVMGSFNKKFEPCRTPDDWISRDEAVVDKYRSDSRTRFTFTLNGYYCLLYSLHCLTERKNLAKMPKTLPVLLIAGENDPVGNFGLGVKKAAVSMKEAGLKQVECKLYPNDRHEILNEPDRQVVYRDVFNWIKERQHEQNL